ncbi:hypothetical protein D3C87_1622780 [compost metagenome]
MQAGVCDKLINHHPLYLQRFVVIHAQLFYLSDDTVHSLPGKAVAIIGNQQPIGSDQGAEGEKIQRRRGVDIDTLVVLGKLDQQSTQLVDLELALKF